MAYTPLADDLTKLIESYEDNLLITPHQRKKWKPAGRKKAVTHAMLGKDHPQALRLLKEDGYDGQPVGSLSSRSAESFWFYNDNHVFPPEDDLIRLGIFMHLDVYRILTLVLKGKWEEFFAREVCEWRANVGRSLSEVLQNEEEMGKALSRFNPDTDQLFSHLLAHGNVEPSEIKNRLAYETSHGLKSLESLVEIMTKRSLVSGIRWLIEARYSPQAFDTLIQTMLLNRIHWVATDSRELDHFKKQAIEEVIICVQGTDDERQRYWRLSHARIQLLMDLDEMYVRIESTRLANAATDYKYLCNFGELEIALTEAKYHCYELEQKVLLKRANPDLTGGELDEQVQKKIEEMKKQIEALREQIRYASLMVANSSIWDAAGGLLGGGQALTDEVRTEYMSKCKKILRQIYLLIHPDRLERDPVYDKLTLEQKRELREILADTLKIKPEELAYPSKFIESRYRSPEALQAVLDRVNFILENAGINIDPQLEIQGKTLPERLSWLEQDIGKLERYLRSAQVELQSLIADEDIQHKRGVLAANDESQEGIKNAMKKQTEEYRQKADELEAELEALLAGDTA